MPKKETLYQRKYDKDHCRWFTFKLNVKTDADVIRMLDAVPSKQGYIKLLITEDIKAHGFPEPTGKE